MAKKKKKKITIEDVLAFRNQQFDLNVKSSAESRRLELLDTVPMEHRKRTLDDYACKTTAHKKTIASIREFMDTGVILIDNGEDVSSYPRMLVSGETNGSGKTQLGWIVYKSWIEAGHNPAFIYWLDFKDQWFNQKDPSQRVEAEKKLEATHLIVDDLFDASKGVFSGATIQLALKVLNNRQQTGKTTFITTNFNAQGVLSHCGGRPIVSDRISGWYPAFSWNGESKRAKTGPNSGGKK